MIYFYNMHVLWNLLSLLYTPEIAELTSTETTWYAQQFLENTSNLQLKSGANHWNAKWHEIMKVLSFFYLQGLHQKPYKECFPGEKYWKL